MNGDKDRWPEVVYRVQVGANQIHFGDEVGGIERVAQGWRETGASVRAYVPLEVIRERLLSDEVVEKAAETFQFGRIFEGDRLLARAALEAAGLAAFPQEESPDKTPQRAEEA